MSHFVITIRAIKQHSIPWLVSGFIALASASGCGSDEPSGSVSRAAPAAKSAKSAKSSVGKKTKPAPAKKAPKATTKKPSVPPTSGAKQRPAKGLAKPGRADGKQDSAKPAETDIAAAELPSEDSLPAGVDVATLQFLKDLSASWQEDPVDAGKIVQE